MKVFPFLLLADRNQGGGHPAFMGTFIRGKPAGLGWYAYDVIIESPTEVEFVVYDIHDITYGGVGKRITSFKASVPEELTKTPIYHKARELASLRRSHELIKHELGIIDLYTQDILNSIK